MRDKLFDLEAENDVMKCVCYVCTCMSTDCTVYDQCNIYIYISKLYLFHDSYTYETSNYLHFLEIFSMGVHGAVSSMRHSTLRLLWMEPQMQTWLCGLAWVSMLVS